MTDEATLDDLVTRLRDEASQFTDHTDLWGEAADAIAALRAENARLIQANEAWHLRVESLKCQVESEGERAERAEARIAALERTLTSVRIAIVSVLCDHDENPCFVGSQGDLAVIRAAIKDIDAARAALKASD